jgi:hypothetical protein
LTWEDTFKIIMSALGATSGASLILFGMSSWLGKIWANRILEKDRKKYTKELEQLKTNNQQTIDKFRAKLEATNLKLTIAYGGIFEKQVNAILELYSKLLELETGANENHLREPEEWNAYRDLVNRAFTFYHEQRVLIPESLDDKILDTIKRAQDVLAHSTNGRTPREFSDDFRTAKLAALSEMRKLLSVGAYNEHT